MNESAPSGLASAPHLTWGSHLAHFFHHTSDLRDVVIPYFKAGLENNERCLFVTGKALRSEEARSALRALVPDLDARESRGQIEIVAGDEWYSSATRVNPQELVAGLLQRERDALSSGYKGLRTGGNCSWVSANQWSDFMDYEALVHAETRHRRMICLCSYCGDTLAADAQVQVSERHGLSLPAPLSVPNTAARRRRVKKAEAPTAANLPGQEPFERQRRTFDMAMIAAHMGTWRYTLADNVCVYDEHAQRLYGLNEARFLHDEHGVKAKFHPDDLELMWQRVAKALDPNGDGRYDVEYRVRQLDGSWRWLSAWGLVEFEDGGVDRKPIAIVGASRDLTKQKEAEALQSLLLSEANHRLKNTVATIQAITAQTLRGATDLAAARQALDKRIRSVAQAHDLLTARAWSGANISDVVSRALEAFSAAQIEVSGEPTDISPRHALGISLALHELATNAAKYGALSCPEGRVSVDWRAQGALLQLKWEERGGPPVASPTRRGFGTRLLEELLALDLGGATILTYAPSGVRCAITAPLSPNERGPTN